MSFISGRLNRLLLVLALALTVLSTMSGSAIGATGMSSAFDFEGRLASVTGHYDFQFRIFDAVSGGSLASPTTLSRPNVALDSGEYRVTLDWGFTPWNTNGRWLEVRYRTHTTSSSAPYTTQSPRTLINAVPYALQSRNAALAAHAASADYAAEAGTATDADYLDGYNSTSFVRGGRSFSYTGPILNAGQQATVTTFGWDADQYLFWKVKPLADGAKMRLTVDYEYHAAGNTYTYWLTVTNTGTVNSTWTVSELDLNF